MGNYRQVRWGITDRWNKLSQTDGMGNYRQVRWGITDSVMIYHRQLGWVIADRCIG
jgi:hypothetical protein